MTVKTSRYILIMIALLWLGKTAVILQIHDSPWLWWPDLVMVGSGVASLMAPNQSRILTLFFILGVLTDSISGTLYGQFSLGYPLSYMITAWGLNKLDATGKTWVAALLAYPAALVSLGVWLTISGPLATFLNWPLKGNINYYLKWQNVIAIALGCLFTRLLSAWISDEQLPSTRQLQP